MSTQNGSARIWRELDAAAGSLDRAVASALRPHGLTVPQYHLLDLLESMRCGCCGDGECRCPESYLCQNDVSARISCTKANVSGLVHRLTVEGMISREPNPNDRRENAVRITWRGRAALLAAQPGVDAALAQVFGGWDEAALNALSASLKPFSRSLVEAAS